MKSNALYSLHHIIIYDISSTLYDVTFTMCVTSHNDSIYDMKHYVYDIFTSYGLTHSVMTTHPLCAFTAIMPDITLSVFLTWHTMYQFYEKKWMYVITASICMTPYALHMTSHPLFMTSHHFIYDIKTTISNIASIISDLTYTVSVYSHPLYQYRSHPMYDISYSIHVAYYPLYLWHHIHYVWQHNTVFWWYHTRHICDIICTTDVITSILSHQTTVFMMSHPLQAWYHTHFIRHHTLCIFDITTSLCHHIPTFLWHHTHCMCDNICSPYNIISTPYVIPLLYL